MYSANVSLVTLLAIETCVADRRKLAHDGCEGLSELGSEWHYILA